MRNSTELNCFYSFALFCSVVYQGLRKKVKMCVFVSLLSYYFCSIDGLSSGIKLVGILFLVLFLVFCVCVVKDLLHHAVFDHTPRRSHFCSEHQTIVDGMKGEQAKLYFLSIIHYEHVCL